MIKYIDSRKANTKKSVIEIKTLYAIDLTLPQTQSLVYESWVVKQERSLRHPSPREQISGHSATEGAVNKSGAFLHYNEVRIGITCARRWPSGHRTGVVSRGPRVESHRKTLTIFDHRRMEEDYPRAAQIFSQS